MVGYILFIVALLLVVPILYIVIKVCSVLMEKTVQELICNIKNSVLIIITIISTMVSLVLIQILFTIITGKGINLKLVFGIIISLSFFIPLILVSFKKLKQNYRVNAFQF